MRNILNAGAVPPGAGVPGAEPSSVDPGDVPEQPMDRSLDGAAGDVMTDTGQAQAQVGADLVEPFGGSAKKVDAKDAPKSTSRSPSMMTSLGRGTVGRPVVALGKLLGAVGSEVGEIAQGTAEILWDAPFEIAEGGAEMIAQVMEDILVAAEPGGAKQEMTPESEKAVEKELSKVLESVRGGLGSLPKGSKNRQLLEDALREPTGGPVTTLSRVRSLMGALSAVADEDREEAGS